MTGVDDNDPSSGGYLTELVKWYGPHKIFELQELPDPFNQTFPQTNQLTTFLCSGLCTMLIIFYEVFPDGEIRCREISCVKLQTNPLQHFGQIWICLSQ